jgi:cyclomaltodextrin glucanotransferase
MLYFVMLDRFAEGDPANTFGKDADHDPERADWSRFWGGDLAGLLARLDYLQSLGVETVVCSPWFEQADGDVQEDGRRVAPYHGYWTRDLRRIDEHFIDSEADRSPLGDARTLIDTLFDAAHARQMRVVVDVTCHLPQPGSGVGREVLFDDGRAVAHYDGRWVDPAGDAWDEETLAYRSYLRATLRAWLARGLDGWRVSSVKHLPLWFWQELAADLRADYPGLTLIGEWYLGGAWDAGSVEFANRSGLSMLDFAWRNALISALARRSERGFQEVAAVVDRDALFHAPHQLVTFVDSHDFPRFLSLSDDPDRFRVALLLTLVARGVPCLFYGGEQGIHADAQRGHDPYNRPMMSSFDATPLGAEIARLAALRRGTMALQKGGMRTKFIDADRYAFTRSWLGSHVLVAANRGDAPAEIAVMGVELPDGVYTEVLAGGSVHIQDGAARLEVPARGIVVVATSGVTVTGNTIADVLVRGVRTQFGESLFVTGDAPELGAWDPDLAVPMEYVNNDCWGTSLGFEASAGAEIAYRFLWKTRDGVVVEPGPVHRRRVPERTVPGGLLWVDDWWS